MKFKIGDKVKVLRKSVPGEIYWNPRMDKAIGKVYRVLQIKKRFQYVIVRLQTESDTKYNFLYPSKGLEKVIRKNQQLLFDFML